MLRVRLVFERRALADALEDTREVRLATRLRERVELERDGVFDESCIVAITKIQ